MTCSEAGDFSSDAVGTPVAGCPPHRPGRAELPHPVLPEGVGVEALCCFPHRSSAFGALPRLCVRRAFCPIRFPLVAPLPSTPSAPAFAALFRSFVGTMGTCDFSWSFISGFWPWPSPCGWLSVTASNHEISRFSRMELFVCMPSFFDRASPSGSRDYDPSVVAFRLQQWRRHLGALFSRLIHAACTPPANASAWPHGFTA
jgi:hypothetical protein